MTLRFQRDASNPKFVGQSGRLKSGTKDTDRRAFPTSDDGTLIEGAVFKDLDSGEEWFYTGDGWQQVVTKDDWIVAELKELRRTVTANMEVNRLLLESINESLMKIAQR